MSSGGAFQKCLPKHFTKHSIIFILQSGNQSLKDSTDLPSPLRKVGIASLTPAEGSVLCLSLIVETKTDPSLLIWKFSMKRKKME